MPDPAADIDSRNHFYLGREHDLATGETAAEPLLYKSKDLTTHAVCVGMTGSGKTGLCLSLLEEAALDGVPAICIDPKGDLGNLLLGFPSLAPEDFRPWVDESVAERKGVTPDAYAEQTASLWKRGLADWGQGPERIARFNDSVERLVFTPGASHGIPLTVLRSFDAPPAALRADADAYRARVQSAVSGLLALLGVDADPVRSREHIFLSNVLTQAWGEGRDLSIAAMIGEIQNPPFKKVGVMDLETFFPEKDRTALAMDLNNLLASPSFAGWMTGAPLDVQQLLYSPEGKPRLSIVSIAHLDDAQRMFFVTILLGEVLAWMRTQPGTGSLRALLYMDEVYGYFPPSKNPPSKEPMLTLLKQARAFGLGCVLATQNPVDLDYKGLSNAGTWFLGRLQTERDKMRVMEGLEGASAQAGSTFDKAAMERTLAGVGSRVFLLNSVHEDQPRVFHTRWAMSYLAGPLSRDAIKRLMDPVRAAFLPPPEPVEPLPEPEADKPNAEAEAPEGAAAETDEPATEASENKPPAPVAADPAKLKQAQAELSRREGELVWAVALAPVKFCWEPLYRGIDLLIAAATKKATQRRTSSVFAALGRSGKVVSAVQKSRAAWADAYVARQAAAGAGGADSVPGLPWAAWIAIVAWLGVIGLAVLLLVGLAWSFADRLLPAPAVNPAVDADPAPVVESVDATGP